jgi:hypothetical protein
MRRTWILGLTMLSCALSATWSKPSHAIAKSDVGYSLPQVYSGALRYLRIDLGYEITERDPETAYLLFKYQAPGKHESSFGAIEMVKTRDRVRLVVRLPQLPNYHESVLRDGLIKKLQEDYGAEEPRESKRRDDGKEPENDETAPDERQPKDKEAPKAKPEDEAGSESNEK